MKHSSGLYFNIEPNINGELMIFFGFKGGQHYSMRPQDGHKLAAFLHDAADYVDRAKTWKRK